MKILHFAVENFARVPGSFVRAERDLGHESLLMTLYRTHHRFGEEDICLDLPFVATRGVTWVKSLLVRKTHAPSNRRRDASAGPPVWKPSGRAAEALFALRDRIWEPRIRRILDSIHIDRFDLLFLDGGAGFLRDGRIVRELREKGIRVAICYCGSDLRTRGIIPSVDRLADVRFTVEFDHTLLDPGLEFVYFPFRLPAFPGPEPVPATPIRIGHAPTNRAVKGTDAILAELERLRRDYPVEIVLIENLAHPEALRLKKSCHLFIDNIGELGYGINGLESLAMGIPTAVQLLPDFEAVLGEHPFINISRETLRERLIPFVESGVLREEYGVRGRQWVEERHDPVAVVRRMLDRISAL
ncbi:MAG TPA: glycosyltransferase family 1 protein [bacterium]|nr:glycosyltransferase family 1 protein [bacterium]